eukprot:3938128-Rhodomonas_salina.1
MHVPPQARVQEGPSDVPPPVLFGFRRKAADKLCCSTPAVSTVMPDCSASQDALDSLRFVGTHVLRELAGTPAPTCTTLTSQSAAKIVRLTPSCMCPTTLHSTSSEPRHQLRRGQWCRTLRF